MSEILQGDVAIVTGAGRNIGEAIAKRFAKEGASVAVVDIDSDRAQSTANDINKEGGNAVSVTTDISMLDDVREMVERTTNAFGAIDILVNNAAIREEHSFLELPEEMFDRVVDVNLKGPFLCTREVSKSMRDSGGGRIVNVSSTSGLKGRADTVAYATTKSGILNFTRSSAKALAEYDIRVNTLIPTRSGVGTLTPDEVKTDNIDDRHFDDTPETLVGRWGIPDDQANAALFLVSEESDFVNGAKLLVDGGISA